VSRRFLIGALAALVLAAAASAQTKLLMPGVTYEKRVEFTFHGPAVIHVLTMPRPGGLWTLKPVLSNDAILGTEKVTAIEQRLSPLATVAGVNGDRFASNGRPSGILVRSGSLESAPSGGRSSIGIDSLGSIRVERVRLLSTWQGTGQRQTLTAVNNSPSSSGVSLYTPAWGPTTPSAPGSVELVLRPFPPSMPNTEIAGPVSTVAAGGGTPIPPDGAVLVARGTAATNRVRAEAPAGTTVRVRLVLQPDWSGVTDAIGGGPVLVRDGRAVFNASEAFVPNQLAVPEPRTAVGQLADGRIVLVAVDGRQPGYSTGMTNFELALALVRLGVVSGAALDGGGSTAMAFDGQLLNRPSGASGERAVSEALLVGYAGVQAPLPAVQVLSPNGDGVAETQQLAYKLVRPSNIDVSLVGPDGLARQSFAGPAVPGTYPVAWNGRTAEGAPELEGRWRWLVSATDDLGRASSFERTFTLNNTLGFAKGLRPSLSVPRRSTRAVAEAALTRAASLTTQIETSSGVLVRTIETALPVQPGAVTVRWDGRTEKGVAVRTGTYVARISAKNELGTVSLAARFSVRHMAAPK
jgi:hypothetical protein